MQAKAQEARALVDRLEQAELEKVAERDKKLSKAKEQAALDEHLRIRINAAADAKRLFSRVRSLFQHALQKQRTTPLKATLR